MNEKDAFYAQLYKLQEEQIAKRYTGHFRDPVTVMKSAFLSGSVKFPIGS